MARSSRIRVAACVLQRLCTTAVFILLFSVVAQHSDWSVRFLLVRSNGNKFASVCLKYYNLLLCNQTAYVLARPTGFMEVNCLKKVGLFVWEKLSADLSDCFSVSGFF